MVTFLVGLVFGVVVHFSGGVDLPSPGDGIGLAPNPIEHMTSTTGPTRSPAVPVSVPFPVSAGVAVATVGVGYRRRREDPLVVLVHGDGGSLEDFEYLVDALRLDPDRVVAFDYSDVDGGASSTESSHTVPTDAAAASLDALLRDLAEDNANIYSIHHSRGGSVGAEMIADLDAGERPPIDGYRGAALLDPAIADGGLGMLQSVGAGSSVVARLIPDDGGFDPIRCSDDGCRDVRDHLGEASGIAVVAIRNPDAEVTNFIDEPEGLRVFDLPDNKVRALLYALVNPLFGWKRITEAHSSVLTSDAAVGCVAAEIERPGSCQALEASAPADGYTSGSGGGRQRVL